MLPPIGTLAKTLVFNENLAPVIHFTSLFSAVLKINMDSELNDRSVTIQQRITQLRDSL